MGKVVSLVDLESRCISYRDLEERKVFVSDLILSSGIFAARDSQSVYLCRYPLAGDRGLRALDIAVSINKVVTLRGMKIDDNPQLYAGDVVIIRGGEPLLTNPAPDKQEFAGQIRFFTSSTSSGNMLLDLQPETLSMFSPSTLSVHEGPAGITLPLYGRNRELNPRMSSMIEGLLDAFCFRLFNEFEHEGGLIPSDEIEFVAFAVQHMSGNYRQLKSCLEATIKSFSVVFGAAEGSGAWREVTRRPLMEFFDLSFEELKVRVSEAALRYRLRGHVFNRDYPVTVS